MDAGINKAFYQKHARKLSATHFELKSSDSKSGKEGELLSGLQRMVLKCHVPDELGIYILQIVPDAATARTAEHFLVSDPLQGVDALCRIIRWKWLRWTAVAGNPFPVQRSVSIPLTMKKTASW